MQNKKYGEYGGQYVAESLMSVLAELETAYNEAINDPKFIEEYNYYLKEYVGRETPLYFAEKLSKKYGTKVYLKRDIRLYGKLFIFLYVFKFAFGILFAKGNYNKQIRK